MGVAVQELKDEINEDVSAEPSRLIRILQLKYKCFIVFVLAFVVTLLMCYTVLKDVLEDEQAGTIMMATIQLMSKIYFPNSTVDLTSKLSEIKGE